MVSREETNFNRLLHRCEAMASEKCFTDWRLDKYVGTLQEYLSKLRTMPANKPAKETLAEYTRKVDLLKGLIDAEKLPSSSERAMAADLLTPTATSVGERTNPSKELHVQAKARYQKDMREELLGKSKPDGHENGELRQRKGGGEGGEQEEDFDTVIKLHQEMQEKLAEEMLYLTKNLKDHASAAGRIVREDNKKISETSNLADSNYAKLKVESERLETHVQKSCSWWMWIMLIVVCCTFIWMVLFMKMFPKR